MAHRFFVVNPKEPDGRQEVYYVTDESRPGVENLDPRLLNRAKDRIVHEDVIEVGGDAEGHVSCEEWPAIQAIANLDEAWLNHRPRFRMALMKVYEMGMRAQRELDRKAEEEQHQFLRETGED